MKVALITGGNAGIGYAIADRLLTESGPVHICLACRNKIRAEKARDRLLQDHPDAQVSIIILDTSSVQSVFKASEEIREKFSRLDLLFLNAGIMKVASVRWGMVLKIFSSKGAQILGTGQGVLTHVDHTTADGLQEVFATNLFGHFIMVRELEDMVTKVIWTSSQNADASALDLSDIQHRNGHEHYSSSKYATDALSVSLNERLNKQGVYSVITCPGLVMSNMTFGILPSWIWTLVMPFLYLMRLFVSSLTCTPHNGAEALIGVALSPSESLNPRVKYSSFCSFLGKPYVFEQELKIDQHIVDSVYDQLEDLYQNFKTRYRKPKHVANGHSVA